MLAGVSAASKAHCACSDEDDLLLWRGDLSTAAVLSGEEEEKEDDDDDMWF